MDEITTDDLVELAKSLEEGYRTTLPLEEWIGRKVTEEDIELLEATIRSELEDSDA